MLCGWGPAPGGVDRLPKTKAEKEAAMLELIPHLKIHADMPKYLAALAAFSQEQLAKAALLPD